MNKKINLIEGAMKSPHLVLAFVFVMMIVGVFGLKNMPRREFPEFTIRQGLVVGVFPGASSLEVEEKLTKEVENYIFGYEEVKKSDTYSYSKEGLMIIFVELNDNVKNSDKFWSKLRHGLDELKMQLPTGVLALVGNNDFGDTSALLITMSSESKSYRELEKIMKLLEADIRSLNSASKIKRFGTQDEKIFVYVKPEKLNQFQIKPGMVLAAFKMQEAIDYAGELDNGELILPIHLPPRFESEKDLEDQIIYADPLGNIIRLKDVARIERKYDTPDNYIRNNGNNSLLLSLEMQKGNNIVHFGEEVEEILNQFREKAPKDVEINVISNLPDVVDHSISHFMKEFIIAILAVIVVTMILLPFRVASVAGITIPISILITLGIMQMIGIQLHIVSLAGLIVVLGMVVDNAIVVIDNHVEKLDHGESPWNAAWKASSELVIPILSATAAIMAAYFPLMLFLTGMGSDFVGSFPLTIGIALSISMIVAMFLVPFMCYIFIKKGLHKENTDQSKNKKSFLDHVQNWYDSALDWTFRNPRITISMGLLSFITGVLILNSVDQKLFPAMDRKQFTVEVTLPEGSSLQSTELVIDSLEHMLMKDERVTNLASFLGNGSPRFNALYMPHLPAKNFGQLIVNTQSNEATIEILDDYNLKYWNAFPNARLKWKQLAIEDYSSPIEIRISGQNTQSLKETAEKISKILEQNENTTWVRTDWAEQRQGISVELDRNKANQLGYGKSLVAGSLLTSMEGLPLTTVWEGDYPLSVILTKEDQETNNINDLDNQLVGSPITMESLPLRSIATLKPEWTEGNIVRRNGVRTITVLVELKRDIIPSNVLKQVRPEIESIPLAKGLKLEYGGDHQASIENMVPLTLSLCVSIVLIFFILLLQFKTIRRVLLVMSTMLLSVLGAALGLKLTGNPFSLSAFIGLIGLIGIVVRNGIILIDYAFTLVNTEGMSYKEAGIAAGKRRMRPIFLTSMAAAMGVVPMIISQSPLWGPMGAVICFGMIIGMVLTLLILPVLYWKSIGNEGKKVSQTIH